MSSKREKLAAYAHKAWSGWMEHLFKQSKQNDDGTVTIPEELVLRWQRQMRTPYKILPPGEKLSDLKEADKMLEITEDE
jgi:hypothetical protein